MLALTEFKDGADLDPSRADFDATRDFFALNVAPAWDARAPAGKRAATLATFADAGEWFAYHEDEAEHEAQDERALELWWGRLHRALPELGDGAEVIETLTPRGYYEQTRRRLGAVWGVARSVDLTGEDGASYRTHLPNLYMVGDTAAGANSIAAVTRAALAVANEIIPSRK
jgi:phytoene dehydrogenase-like protein